MFYVPDDQATGTNHKEDMDIDKSRIFIRLDWSNANGGKSND